VREFLASQQVTVLEHAPYSVPEDKGNIERKAF
jgi:hypothetical protein